MAKKIPVKGLPHVSNGAPFKSKKKPLPPSHSSPVSRAEVGGMRKQRRAKKGNEGTTMAKGSLGFKTIKPKAERIGSTQKSIPKPKRGNV
jgi:hypothetical protein